MKTKNKLGYYCAVFLLAIMLSCEHERVINSDETTEDFTIETIDNASEELQARGRKENKNSSLYTSNYHAVYNANNSDPYERSQYKSADGRRGPVLATFHAGNHFTSNSLEVRGTSLTDYKGAVYYGSGLIDLKKVLPIRASSWNFDQKIKSFSLAPYCWCLFTNGAASNSRDYKEYVISNYSVEYAKYAHFNAREAGWSPRKIEIRCRITRFNNTFAGFAHDQDRFLRSSLPLYAGTFLYDLTGRTLGNAWKNNIRSLTIQSGRRITLDFGNNNPPYKQYTSSQINLGDLRGKATEIYPN